MNFFRRFYQNRSKIDAPRRGAAVPFLLPGDALVPRFARATLSGPVEADGRRRRGPFHVHDGLTFQHFLARLTLILLAGVFLGAPDVRAEFVGERWGTAERERAFYKITNLPIPPGLVVESGAFCAMPDGRIAVGTRRGDIYMIDGVDEAKPEPRFHLFATGLDEIFGLTPFPGDTGKKKGDRLLVTQSCELTAVSDLNKDGRAEVYQTVSDAWGYANYHEYAFGSPIDKNGDIYVALGLSASYHSRALFRGWVMKIEDVTKSRSLGRVATATPFASGLRSPGGIGPNEHGQLMYIESQGPWNSSCSLKAIEPRSFHGHPISTNWYPYANDITDMGPAPKKPTPQTRIATESKKINELTPYAVIFPYIRMGRSITGFRVDETGGKFGPFENQIFLGDYTQSLVMRATTEKVGDRWQGACYPFREGLGTGILNVNFTPGGRLITGGTNRGWPVRGIKPFALERLDWTGVTPFEIERITIRPDGFRVRFTKPVDANAEKTEHYKLGTFTHIYHGAYGGPEVDQTKPEVAAATVSEDGRHVDLKLASAFEIGHCYEFDLGSVTSKDGDEMLHRHAYYTVNAVPENK